MPGLHCLYGLRGLQSGASKAIWPRFCLCHSAEQLCSRANSAGLGGSKHNEALCTLSSREHTHELRGVMDADISSNADELLFREKKEFARDSLVLHRLCGLVSSLRSRGTPSSLLAARAQLVLTATHSNPCAPVADVMRRGVQSLTQCCRGPHSSGHSFLRERPHRREHTSFG